MFRSARLGTCIGGGVLGLGVWVVWGVSCTTAPTPFFIEGQNVSGNEPPTLTILEPTTNLVRDQGSNFIISWTDSDRDSSALISFAIQSTTSANTIIQLVDNIQENDTTGPDQITIGTSLVPQGTYNLFGTINDDVNPAVTVYALTTAANTTQRAVITVVPPGQGQQGIPPVLTVTQPLFNQSVAQDDQLLVSVQPTPIAPIAGVVTPPFDPDSNVTLYILLDLDQDPNNDDPANPDPLQIIPLRQQVLQAGSFDKLDFDITIDLTTIPPRPNGEPYFIRVTADDLTNPRVHQYAVGSINVAQLASGLVDLFDVGKTISGVRCYGFNPGANLGSSMSSIGDFDADGVPDFVLVAQHGNPRNFGLVGEAYGIYGQNRIRFGGSLAVNSVGETISGVIFEGPPIRTSQIPDSAAHSDGITDVNFIRDLTGDGRPEILFGMAYVHGMIETTDYDPGDSDLTTTDNNVMVTVTVRQGEARVTVGDNNDETVNFNYRGMDDTTISSEAPNGTFGSTSDVSWQSAGTGVRQWGLLKFKDVLREIPDNPGDIDSSTVAGNLIVRVFRTGGDATLHQALTDFSEQSSYATFARGGGDPRAGVRGDATADYLVDGSGGGLGNLSGTTAEEVQIDISNLVRQLIDGELSASNDELRFIVVPSATEGQLEASARSSEFSIEADRPTLSITYTRRNFLGFLNCYPDDLVNNQTDTDGASPVVDDTYFFAGGAAMMVNSTNRNNAGLINPLRLERTSVALELVGVRTGLVLSGDAIDLAGGGIFARAENATADPLLGENGQEGRISGTRFNAGGYDFVDARFLNQPPRDDLFGQNVASIGDLNNDGVDEIVISAPRNERHFQDLIDNFGFAGTHRRSTIFPGSIVVLPGTNYNDTFWREKPDENTGSAVTPNLDQNHFPPFGTCTTPIGPRHYFLPSDAFEVFAESIDDFLGGASSAGDFNQDGLDDILCGAPMNDRSASLPDTGAVYVLYGRNVIGDFHLNNADDPIQRAPMLRIRGVNPGDQIGRRQVRGLDVNGDRIDDEFIASPTADFGGVRRSSCGADFNGDGVVDTTDLSSLTFNSCRNTFGAEVFSDDACKAFDYNNDTRIDDEDESVFRCLSNGGSNCCANLVDNGFIGILFGGVFIDGDRTINQIATSDLPGVTFYGSGAGHRAGADVSSAGDFNQDGFGDLLIAVPGETRLDSAGRERLGVVYLIFGGTHLRNKTFNLAEVGSADLPGIVFLSPYVKGRPNESAPVKVAFIGDINNDGFGDIAVGNPKADFIDLSFPQGPDATDATVGRRRDAGDAYLIYGNNFGSNRSSP